MNASANSDGILTMSDEKKKSHLKEQLILAGIDEIDRHGITDFSIRRVAASCGVSSGAPYKHFRDKHEFIAEIVRYINQRWQRKQLEIVQRNPDNTRAQLVESGVDYVKFLVENPHFRSIIMLKDDDFDSSYHKMRGKISELTSSLIAKYCEEVKMDDVTRRRKFYVVRALVYGAALMFDNGEMELNEENLNFVRQNIDREFDLP